MTQATGSQLVGEQLKRESVGTLFFIMGGPIIDVAGAAAANGIRIVDVRHEQAAAMAAHAYARATGKPGVCLAASGPATTNLLTGITNAWTDAAPVIALGGASPTNQFGMDAFRSSTRSPASARSRAGPSGRCTRRGCRNWSTPPSATPPARSLAPFTSTCLATCSTPKSSTSVCPFPTRCSMCAPRATRSKSSGRSRCCNRVSPWRRTMLLRKASSVSAWSMPRIWAGSIARAGCRLAATTPSALRTLPPGVLPSPV